jgi:hypothetical protein
MTDEHDDDVKKEEGEFAIEGQPSARSARAARREALKKEEDEPKTSPKRRAQEGRAQKGRAQEGRAQEGRAPAGLQILRRREAVG